MAQHGQAQLGLLQRICTLAVNGIEGLFASAKTDRAALGGKTVVSAGELINGEPPALWLTPELATKHWHDAMLKQLLAIDTADKTLIWIDPPKLEKFEITICDAMRTHRLAQDRYIVICKYAIGD